MAFRILLYFGLLAVGWVLSSKGLINKKISGKISHLQTVVLFGLIFVMGVSVGMDEQVFSSIGKIGFMAAAFAVTTSGFSMLLVYVARKKFFKDEKITGGRHD